LYLYVYMLKCNWYKSLLWPKLWRGAL